jgi:hypothetical protein
VPDDRFEPVYGDVVRQADEQGSAMPAEGMRGRVVKPYGPQMEGAVVPREQIRLPSGKSGYARYAQVANATAERFGGLVGQRGEAVQVEPAAKEGQMCRNYFRERRQAIEVQVPAVTTDHSRWPRLQLAEAIEVKLSRVLRKPECHFQGKTGQAVEGEVSGMSPQIPGHLTRDRAKVVERQASPCVL